MKKFFQAGSFFILTLTMMACGPGLFAGEPPTGSLSPLRVGIAPTSAPMVFKEGKNIVGVEADLAHALGRELGRSVSFVELPWEELIDALEANKIDIIMSSMSVTRARQFRVAFSDPYLRVGQMALIRASDKSRYLPLGNVMANRVVGVKKGTTGDLLVQQEFPNAKRKYFNSGEDAARALSKNKIDLFFNDSSMIYYLAGKYEAQGLVVAPMVFSDETLAWAMRRSDADLLASVNSALKNMTASGELTKVLGRWIPKLE
jgi:polar amino acid transport system substrate-binding protein